MLSSADDVTAWFDCVFWMGDLNFRLEKERERVDETVKGIDSLEVPSYDDLMEHDELFRLRNEGKVCIYTHISGMDSCILREEFIFDDFS